MKMLLLIYFVGCLINFLICFCALRYDIKHKGKDTITVSDIVSFVICIITSWFGLLMLFCGWLNENENKTVFNIKKDKHNND